MNHGIFIGLVNNAALLMALGIVFDSITLRNLKNKNLANVISGICLGVIALAIMHNPIILMQGVNFDTRSILLSLTAMFFGVLPTSIAMFIALAYRIWQGGTGIYMGCLVIITSVLWGYFWKRLHGKWNKPYSFIELYAMGIVNQITMLSLVIFLPSDIRLYILKSIYIPVLLIYPFATVFLGMLIARRIQRSSDKFDLQESEKQFRNLYDNAPIAYQALDAEGNFITVNQTWLQTTGYALNEVIGNNFADFLKPESQAQFTETYPKFKTQGHMEGCEFIFIKRDGLPLLLNFNGRTVTNEKGGFQQAHCVFTDITAKRRQDSALKSIEWMLSKHQVESVSHTLYGDLSESNSDKLILDSVGMDVLKELVNDYLSLLDTSATVYEKNGDYAIDIVSSAYCQYLDIASRNLCDTDNNEVAISCGKWLCQESSWTDISKKTIEFGDVIDSVCHGGINFYSVPIRTSAGIIGAINLSYGNPPSDEQMLKTIADKFKVNLSELKQKASQYQSRPAFIIEQAKRKLHTAARIIGEIVERKQTELELIKATNDWESIFRAIPHPTLILDINQNIIAANPFLEKALGLTNEQIQGKKCWELMHGDALDAPPPGCPFANSISQDSVTEEMEVKALHGYYMVTCKPIYDQDGNLEKVIHIAMDITERKKAETVLSESEEKYRVLADTAKDIILVHQLDGSISYANKVALDFLGVMEDEIEKINLWERIPVGYHEMLKKNGEERNLGYLGSRLYQLEMINYKGENVYMDVSSSPIISDGAFKGFLAVVRDITERISDQIAIKESEEKYRRLIETSNEGILTLDTNHVVTFVNQRLVELTGFSESDILGHPMISFISQEDLDDHNNKLFERAQGKDDQYERKVRTKTGHNIWFLVSAKGVFDNNGDFAGSFLMLTDITAKKLAEQELARYADELESKVEERTEQLKHANKELETFSYSVAHDLRSPLRAIDGYSNILLEDYISSLDDGGKHLLYVIKENALKMDTLIRELLDLARLNPYSMNKTKINMNKMVADIMDRALKHEVGALFDIHVNNLPTVMGDETLVHQVWQNLIANAIKFTLPQSQKMITVGSLEQKKELIFFIKDSGVGFDMKFVDKIFGPFQRLHRAQDFEGTGIGLAIVQKIIQRHNGRIWVESEVGKGTTFYFTLPQ